MTSDDSHDALQKRERSAGEEHRIVSPEEFDKTIEKLLEGLCAIQEGTIRLLKLYRLELAGSRPSTPGLTRAEAKIESAAEKPPESVSTQAAPDRAALDAAKKEASSLLKMTQLYLRLFQAEVLRNLPVLSGSIQVRFGNLGSRIGDAIRRIDADQAQDVLCLLAQIHQEIQWSATGWTIGRLLPTCLSQNALQHGTHNIGRAIAQLDPACGSVLQQPYPESVKDDFEIRFFFAAQKDSRTIVHIEPLFRADGSQLCKGIEGRHDGDYPSIIRAIWGALAELKDADGGEEKSKLLDKLNQLLTRILEEVESRGKAEFAGSAENRFAWDLFDLVTEEFDEFSSRRSTIANKGQKLLGTGREGRFNTARERILNYCTEALGIEEDRRFDEGKLIDHTTPTKYYHAYEGHPSPQMSPVKIVLLERPGYVIKKNNQKEPHRMAEVKYEAS